MSSRLTTLLTNVQSVRRLIGFKEGVLFLEFSPTLGEPFEVVVRVIVRAVVPVHCHFVSSVH